MPETAERYIGRILGYVEGQDAVKVQRSTAAKLKKYIQGLTPKQLKWRPEPAKWSIAEIIAHLADAEIVASWRMRSVIGENVGLSFRLPGSRCSSFLGTLPHPSGEQSRDVEGDPARDLGQLRNAPGTGERNDRAPDAHVRRPRHQPCAPGRAHREAAEERGKEEALTANSRAGISQTQCGRSRSRRLA
jgi:DinB superfamily